MSKVRLYGSTSGFVELAAPAISDDGVLVLPTAAQGILSASGGIGSNVVQTVKTDTFSTNSTTFVDVTGLTVTITPTSATSKILVVAYANVSNETSGRSTFIRLVRDSTTLFVGDAAGSAVRATYGGRVPASTATEAASPVFLDSPDTTTAVVYKVEMRRGSSAGVAFLNRTGFGGTTEDDERVPSSITVIEVAA